MVANLASARAAEKTDREQARRSASGGGGGGDDTSTSSQIDQPFVCFAPGTPDEVQDIFSALTGQGQLAEVRSSSGFSALAFQQSNKWSLTALNGFNTGGDGDPVTLTWSIVPDGLSIPGSNGEPTAPSNLRAWLDDTYGSEATWLPLFQSVFDRWEELTGNTYVYVTFDDQAAFPNSRGRNNRRADVRIAGHTIDGSGGVLAYNFFPNGGDMVIDTADTFLESTFANSRRLRNTISHEHGHGLALGHVCPVNRTKLMEPSLSTSFDGPQIDEIYSTQRLYGDRFENTDTAGAAEDLGTLPSSGSTVVEDLSIDDNNDVDFYEFATPGSGFELTAIARPVGLTYLEGPQTSTTCNGTSFNSLNQRDLAIQIRDSNGTTVLASSNTTGAGSAETISNFSLPGSGPYFVRVSATAVDTLQLYELEISVRIPVVPTISIANLLRAESSSIANVPVSLSNSTGEIVTVDWQTSAGTASAGLDFQSASGTLTIPAGLTQTTIPVSLLNDTIDEDSETFQVTLSQATNATLDTAQATVTIIDNDQPPVIETVFQPGELDEPGGSFQVDFNLSGPSGRSISFDYTTVDGSAEAGSDYTAVSGTITLAPGTLNASIGVAIINDADPEPDEVFTLALSDLENVTATGSSPQAIILDDDAPLQLVTSGGTFGSDPTTGGFVIGWSAVPGRSYRIEDSNDLITWDIVPGAENLNPSTSQGSFVDSRTSDPERRFYRVVDQG